MIGQGGTAAPTVLALVLALACAGFSVRAIHYEPPPPETRPLQGAFTAEEAPAARALVERLARGVLGLQRPDGGFDLGPNAEYSYQIERVASSALATAALATLQRQMTWTQFPPGDGALPAADPGAGGKPERLPGLAAAVALGLDYLKKQQIETGAIGREEPKDHWSQIDATAAAVLAFVTAGRPEDDEAMRGASSALRRFARAGLRNGWTRALGVMTAEAVNRQGQAEAFGGDPRALADLREMRQVQEGLPQASDWNVAEAISRAVMGRSKVGPFAQQVVLACLGELPAWIGQSSDCQAWWMHAWLVGRSGSEKAAAWFAALRKAIEEEGIEDDGTIHGGWYANTLSQSSAAILALLAGLTSEVASK